MVLAPRKIKLFQQKLNELNQYYDCFIIKNEFKELEAYKTGRNFFLSHPEYTHLAILPDDLLVEVEDVQQLIKDIEKFNYPVISGICNFNASTKKFFNMMSCLEFRKYGHTEIMKRTGKYDWRAIMVRDEYDDLLKKGNTLIRVSHTAFPFQIIRRDVVEKIEFGHNPMGVDVVFSQDCLNNNIPIYVDLRVETFHLKGAEDNKEMRNIIDLVIAENIYTKVNTNKLNPPKREEIFLPKQIG